MKVAITSTGNSLESTLDHRFSQCAYFVIYDNESNSMEFIPNPIRTLREDAETASIQLVASRRIDKIISGDFGIKIKALLDRSKIQMIVLKKPDIKIIEIIEMLNH